MNHGDIPEKLPVITGNGNGNAGRLHHSQLRFVSFASGLRMVVKTFSMSIIACVFVVALASWPAYALEDVQARQNILCMMFMLGLFLVSTEDVMCINKSAVMLLIGGVMWTFLAVSHKPFQSDANAYELHEELDVCLKEVGAVVLFLLPAMAVVEAIDHLNGFSIITHIIKLGMQGHKERLMPIICIITFMLSSVIDNLTATILALKILKRVAADDHELRCLCGGVAVIAANAGGAWSPVGDVTTTMLWIQGKITPGNTVKGLLLPSFCAGVVPLVGLQMRLSRRVSDTKNSGAEGCTAPQPDAKKLEEARIEEEDKGVSIQELKTLGLGLICILLVPALKIWTGVPPYLGMLLALAALWVITDSNDREGETDGHASSAYGVVAALGNVDLTGLLFFTGVLLSVGALNAAGVLRQHATYLSDIFGDQRVMLCTILGLSSAVVDNVPLVEASIDMFTSIPTDDPFWQMTALAAGTGGSILSIGSIAGVTLMSMEGVSFMWYFRNISCMALLGFASGMLMYQVQQLSFGFSKPVPVV